jgi:hypothetical protein
MVAGRTPDSRRRAEWAARPLLSKVHYIQTPKLGIMIPALIWAPGRAERAARTLFSKVLYMLSFI